MTADDRARFEVLLENIDGNVKVIAEGQGAIVDRLDRIEHRLEVLGVKVDKLDVRAVALDVRSEGMDRRLVRVERHLDLDGGPRPRAKRRAAKKRAA
jgi:ribosome assembly protein YihI (activator of Der GTPase)